MALADDPTGAAPLSYRTDHAERAGRIEAERATSNGVVRRALRVLQAAWRHLLLPRLLGRRVPSRAERMQAALEDLGGTWIKLGQALALRFDILPADYCLQFFRLLNQVPPFSATAGP